jgi:hypothetical protein
MDDDIDEKQIAATGRYIGSLADVFNKFSLMSASRG